MGQTFGDRIAKLMDDHFVGREFELEYFRQWLIRLEERSERILNISGTTGMGKTYLLDRYARIASELGAAYVRVDVREAMGLPDRLLESIHLQIVAPNSSVPPGASLLDRCFHGLNELAERGKLVLAFDGYEEIGDLDHWLRATLLPGLSGNTLVVISGRFPLEGPWRHAPAWKKLIVRLPLNPLGYNEIRGYLRKWGIEEESAVDSVWLRTMGHPLALSLLTPIEPVMRSGLNVAVHADGTAEREEPLRALLDNWLREAPDDELRRLLYAASTVRFFHQDLLSRLVGEEIAPTLFQRLADLSFVSRSANGCQLQELVKETLQRQCRERMPETYEAYRRRAIEHYRGRIEEGLAQGKDIVREFGECLRYADNAVLRAHYRHARESRNYTEPLTADNMPEARAYIRRRLQEKKPSKVLCSDPESGESFRFELSAAIGRSRLSLVPLEELMATGTESVKLLRNPEGRIVGLFAIVPVNGSTYDFLARAPVSQAYLSSLPDEEKRRIRASKDDTGIRYVYAMDVERLESEELRADIIHALLDPILAGRLLVESPPPHDYYRLGKASLGFEPLAGAEHLDYGDGQPAPTYILDTRREKGKELLDRLIREPGGAIVAATAPPTDSPAKLGQERLTPREREVAALLAQGLTNAEIASRLFVSEAAVKKHVNAMLSKYALRNRTQLANHIHLTNSGGTLS
ncbi:LuxR C-terminal-related transcriptional regulator [Cohnella sp. AR92]|uniref:LuxR C-terminal-related transcriptional regulator n=1 Tax=Cohnella sp. AR92 TaxID=648716 RepID=UPI001EDFB7D6|nr:LuxR C-terminal-related transcriptional regulator [Cohnella sp. AR92]